MKTRNDDKIDMLLKEINSEFKTDFTHDHLVACIKIMEAKKKDATTQTEKKKIIKHYPIIEEEQQEKNKLKV